MSIVKIDPQALAKAMTEDNKYPSRRFLGGRGISRREAARLAKAEKREQLHPTELVGRTFNKIIESLPLKEREQYKCCFYCGDELIRHAATKDHIYPFHKGGTITVPACKECNHAKGGWPLEHFRLQCFGKDHVFWGEMVIARGREGLRAACLLTKGK